ncbi:MAG: sugar-binding protein [Armatimonadetes bacterium]|nr:sugar-binding protein [Armatimonadota bacterium]
MKLFRFALALSLACVLTTGCAKGPGDNAAGGPSGSGRLQIAGLGKSVHPFWDQVEMGMKAAAGKAGVDVEFYVPSKEDAQKQAEKIKSWVALGKNGILFAASDPETVGPAIKDAIARKITCVAMDTDAPDSGRAAYVGTDNYLAGKTAAEEMAKELGGKGKVCIATGSVTASNSLERIKGFKEVMAAKYPGITVLPEVLVDNEDRAVAIQKAKAKLAATPDLAAFFGVYALNGPSCAIATESAGRTGKVKIVCFDNLKEHMNMLKQKKLDVVIGQRPYLMGLKGVEVISAIIRDGKDEALKGMGARNGIIDTGVDIVRPQDVEKYRAELKKLGIPVEGW